MASPISFLPVVLALLVSLRCPSVYGDREIPGQMVVEAFKCFDNKFIYNGCESAYRLNPSGSFNVPPEATNLFCNGPCLMETQLVLNCLDKYTFQNFLFYNKATAQSVRNALRVGCSFSSQRGNFNQGLFMQGEFSKAHTFQKWFILHYSILFLVGCCCFLIL